MTIRNLDIRKQFWRFKEIYDLYTVADGRRSLVIPEEVPFVSDTNLFLSYCFNNKVLFHINMDGSQKEWKILSGASKIKTMIYFMEGRISYEDLMFHEIESYLRHKFLWAEIESFVTYPAPEDKESLIKFLSE